MQLNPNPATDQVLLEMRKPIAGQYTVEIVGLSGAVILRQTMELSAADQVTIPLALNDVPSGVALIRISTPAGVYRMFLSVVR
jgi:hypothetical protein